jgi:hypothetical protein
MKKNKCGCRPILGLSGIVLVALGIYAVVWGFLFQASSILAIKEVLITLLAYLVGVFLLGFGCMLKYKGYNCCSIHSR